VTPRPLHVYVHLPFCARKCGYCAFVSMPAPPALHAAYCTALVRDITQYFTAFARAGVAFELQTLYLGGGTPSCVAAPLLADVLNAARACCAWAPQAEVTVECNPQSLSSGWLAALAAAGVNRWSLGVQSLAAGELAALARLHTPAQARAAFALLRAQHCTNVSVDLMYGIPQQTAATWRATVREIAAEWQPEHVSLYALSIECGTRFARYQQDTARGWHWPDGDEMMDWYWQAEQQLTSARYTRYEISNYARPGREAQHNLAYWDTARDYVGFGAAAHSFCRPAPGAPRRRFRTIRAVRDYIRRVNAGEPVRVCARALPRRQAMGETIYLGLRRAAGIRLDAAQQRCFGAQVQRQIAAGLLYYCAPDTIALTRRGVELANEVMADFV
jgi:oxygen-independent coproporphyrinogen-3 oxidase